MAVELILQRADGGGTINLYNKEPESLSTVTKAEQKISLLGEDVVNITVESAVKIPFSIGDKTTIFGRDYKINRLPKPKKTGNRLLEYDIELEGVQYDLARATYDLNIDTTNNELQDVQADTLTGNLWRFASVLIANANRVFPGKWSLGEYPDDTEDKTLAFDETDNCLLVVQRICAEYNIEFDIVHDGDVNTINFRKIGHIFPYTFEYGKGKGLYELERQNVSSANIVTRLKVYGGTRNISYKYRANRLCLPGKSKGQSYIEKPDVIATYGIWEATKYLDNIFPSRTGTITGVVSGSVLKFVDNTMNFDLNEKEADGVTTKYLLDGITAKIHFNSGNLSGFEFELQAYDHTTKTFTLKPFKDERDETYPAERSTAYQFAVGDKYVILDIALPKSYEDDAEERLTDAGKIYYDQNCQPKVQYSLEVAEELLKEISDTGSGGIANIFQVGDYLPVKDSDIEVDKSVRIQGFTRDLINEYEYSLTISDTVTTNITNRVISELIDIDKVIKINNLKDPARARRGWRSALEALNEKYLSKINPDTAQEVITLLAGLEVGEFVPGMFGGKGANIDKLGNAEMTSLRLRAMLEVPELRYNRLTVIGDEFILTENGLIESVEQLAGRSFQLNMKLEEGEPIAMLAGDLVKGIYHHSNGFYTSYMRVEEVGETFMKVTLVNDSDTPTGYNFPPMPIMNLARCGNASDPDRQRYMVFSSKLGGFQLFDGASTFLNAELVGSYDVAQSFKSKFSSLPLKEGLPYMYLAGIVVQDIIRVDYKGKNVREVYDRGPWEAGRSYYNNDEQGTDDVWHLGCRWRCFSSSTTEEPSWTSAAWYMIEGRSDARMEFDVNLFGALPIGFKDFIITPVVFIGNTNVSYDITDEQWRWTRDSGYPAADAVWNAQRQNNGRILVLANHEEMGVHWSRSNPVKFTCEATYPASSINKIINYVEI